MRCSEKRKFIHKTLLNEPDLDKEWKHFFQGFDFAQESYDIDIKGNDIPK
jgi:hypothetical protein